MATLLSSAQIFPSAWLIPAVSNRGSPDPRGQNAIFECGDLYVIGSTFFQKIRDL